MWGSFALVDEEHDSSYKQDNLPKYHGRDVAIRRAQMLGVPIVLGSATPALESWQNARLNPAWKLLSLTSRPLGMEMPRVVVVDMKGQSKERKGLHILSTTLEHHLKQTLAAKKQAIFLLNRRGYAHYVMCPRCDWVLMCENCDATMVVHRKRVDEESETERHARGLRGKVQCHYCLTAMVLPFACPLCQARLTHLGQGTQRAEDELLRKFPGLRLKRMDSDSMTSGDKYQETLDAFGRGELDLLIGTQMISKGLDLFSECIAGGGVEFGFGDDDSGFSGGGADVSVDLPSGRGERGGREERARGRWWCRRFSRRSRQLRLRVQHDYLGFCEFGVAAPGKGLDIRRFGEVGADRAVAQGVYDGAWGGGWVEAVDRGVDGEVWGCRYVCYRGRFHTPMERLVEMYRVEIILFAGTAGPVAEVGGEFARERGVDGRGGGGFGGCGSVDDDVRTSFEFQVSRFGSKIQRLPLGVFVLET